MGLRAGSAVILEVDTGIFDSFRSPACEDGREESAVLDSCFDEESCTSTLAKDGKGIIRDFAAATDPGDAGTLEVFVEFAAGGLVSRSLAGRA